MDNSLQEENSTPPERDKESSPLNASIVIAVLALLISSLSAFVSLKESKIMMEQQQLLAEQKEASVWPYLSNMQYHQFIGDSSVNFQYVVVNKGIGPAIIDSVTYTYADSVIEPWALFYVLKEKFPTLKIIPRGNAALGNRVLAPGEEHIVVSVQLTKTKDDKINIGEILDQLDLVYKLEYCYCSVYGQCWKVKAWDDVKRSDECAFREEIR